MTLRLLGGRDGQPGKVLLPLLHSKGTTGRTCCTHSQLCSASRGSLDGRGGGSGCTDVHG